MQQRILLSGGLLLLQFHSLLVVNVSGSEPCLVRSLIASDLVEGQIPKHQKLRFKLAPWGNNQATFCGGADASGTNARHDGLACGSCNEIKYIDQKWCTPGQPSIFITGTNLCPDSQSAVHFDLSQPAFSQIADLTGDIIHVPCKKEGIRFTISGNPYCNKVLVGNVKCSQKLKWTTMRRDWGQNWVTDAMLVGESFTFRVIAGNGRSYNSWHITDTNWQFG
ncbi:hypothetical protein MKX01_032033 [Papaver californicum]|nr:hypothetical protein MKX01_032033 [Papaver californicum]